MRILVTAGATREYLDPVRFLSNGSTGKMGYACAAAARRRGHRVTLVSGAATAARPTGVRMVKVGSAAQMKAAVDGAYGDCDCVIMTAAVCDYRPAKKQKYKMAKGEGKMVLELERTEDILAGLGAAKREDQILIGFAVQDRAGRTKARAKLRGKNLDAIVLNGPGAFGAEGMEAAILTRDGGWEELGQISKKALATRIVRFAEKLVGRSQ